jgi:hypothetical protein
MAIGMMLDYLGSVRSPSTKSDKYSKILANGYGMPNWTNQDCTVLGKYFESKPQPVL